jgi:hypothetical protein
MEDLSRQAILLKKMLLKFQAFYFASSVYCGQDRTFRCFVKVGLNISLNPTCNAQIKIVVVFKFT